MRSTAASARSQLAEDGYFCLGLRVVLGFTVFGFRVRVLNQLGSLLRSQRSINRPPTKDLIFRELAIFIIGLRIFGWVR